MDIFREMECIIKNQYKNILVKISKPNHNFKMKNNKVTCCCTLTINAETERKKKAINDKLKNLVLKYIDEPQKLIRYMKFNKLNVYTLKYANIILNLIKEEEGFITPKKGLEALIINLLIGIMSEKKLIFKLSTKPLFIFSQNNDEIFTIARALYKYYGFKNKLPGYDYHSQQLFKKIYNSKNKTTSPFENRTIEEMYACKDAINRDLESINFTIQLSEETQGAKFALNKIKENKSANI